MVDNATDEARKPREQERRASEPVHEEYPEYYEDDTLLSTDNIPAREGYVQRWVRTVLNGKEDQSNVFRKINKGWRPRLMSTVPKGQFVTKIDFNGTDVVGIHGMILMERPEALHERQQRAKQNLIDLQMRAVKENMYAVHDPSSGLTRPEMRATSTNSVGRMPTVDD